VETPNFQTAFDEYSSLRRGGSYRGVDETAPKPSAFRAFERLLSASLVAYTDARYLSLLSRHGLCSATSSGRFPLDLDDSLISKIALLKQRDPLFQQYRRTSISGKKKHR
jgi:hypothetical protein